jgi:hypothetical protein
MARRPDPIDEIRRLDPVDGARLAASWDGSDAKQALFQEITTMPVDTDVPDARPTATAPTASTSVPARPRRRVAVALAGGIAAAAALAIVPGLLPDSGSAAYALRELPDGVLEIDTTRGSMDVGDGHSLAAELSEFGIDTVIETRVASPSLVGDIYVFGPDWEDTRPAGISYGEDGSPDVFTMRIDPELFTDTITIVLNVAAQGDEPYVMTMSPFEPGEALDGLHCALGEPLRASELAAALDELGVVATWETVAPTADPGVIQSTPSSAVPAGEVTSALAVRAGEVEVAVVEDGVTVDGTPWGHVFDDGAPCTSERAAAWR